MVPAQVTAAPTKPSQGRATSMRTTPPLLPTIGTLQVAGLHPGAAMVLSQCFPGESQPQDVCKEYMISSSGPGDPKDRQQHKNGQTAAQAGSAARRQTVY